MLSYQRDDTSKLTNKVETFNINLSKCYEDLLEFKDNMYDLLTSFKIEFAVN